MTHIGYGSIPIDTFLVGWTSIYQLFWCSLGPLGTRVLTHPHMSIFRWFVNQLLFFWDAGHQRVNDDHPLFWPGLTIFVFKIPASHSSKPHLPRTHQITFTLQMFLGLLWDHGAQIVPAGFPCALPLHCSAIPLVFLPPPCSDDPTQVIGCMLSMCIYI